MLLNAYVTHRDPPPIDFPHTLRGRRDRSDRELVAHLRGFMGFVTQRGKRPMNATRYAVIRHLERVRHHVALEIDVPALPAFARWASAANSLVFTEDARVTAPDGATLVDPETGDAAPGAVLPYPVDSVGRKAATDAKLTPLGIQPPGSLPPVVSEIEVELRTPADVARRSLALFACALRAESISTGNEIPVADLRARLPLAVAAMTDAERAFFDASPPERQTVVNHLWRYESLAVLAWALELTPQLPFPNAITDVPALAKVMFAQNTPSFGVTARLRPTAEILDALDLHFRLHWATTDARVKRSAPPGSLEASVVLERHYALNWLTRFEDAPWDDVTTPT
ncbi:DUF4272 domain-containing protein [soil metagenome]